MASGLLTRVSRLEDRIGDDGGDAPHCTCPGYRRPFWWDGSVALVAQGVPVEEVVERQRCPVCGRLPMVVVTGGAHREGAAAITLTIGEMDPRERWGAAPDEP